ncbi:MAG: hypothetical protein GY854_21715 [Deltaproteobacteria bacterium]|nr:hypothetical protein [Deltaproteobacteria bacterium]
METKIYGASDDLIEFGGDIYGEVDCYGTDDREHGVLVLCSDGTVLEVKYGKADQAIWGIQVIAKGDLFLRIDPCTDEEANPHSDVAHFCDGLKWAYAATGDWEKVA